MHLGQINDRPDCEHVLSLQDCCLVFLLDRSYLKGLFALMASLLWTVGLAALPVVVLSDDQSVIDESEVRGLAAHRMLIGADFLARYKEPPRAAIPEQMRREHVPKYTCLKFAAFQEFGYRQNIYLDKDMAALGPLDGFFHRLKGQDLKYAAAPNIPRQIWGKSRAARSSCSALRPSRPPRALKH